MSSTFLQFSEKEEFWILVVEIPPIVMNAICGAISPRLKVSKETESEIKHVIERWGGFVSSVKISVIKIGFFFSQIS